MIKVALVGQPNAGKTTLFNALTGSNQYVGNWPGVTVEKKEGIYRKDKQIEIMDLPGIYSLSAYSPEEKIARNYLLGEDVSVLVNIVDGTNLERNLYLSMQCLETEIPMVMAINMGDIVNREGDVINVEFLSELFGIPVVSISALKETGLDVLMQKVAEAASQTRSPKTCYNENIEQYVSRIESIISNVIATKNRRFIALKLLEKDDELLADILSKHPDINENIQKEVREFEQSVHEESDSYVINERYKTIEKNLKRCYKKKNEGTLSTSDKIDKVLTHRVLGLPIFALTMFLIYYLAMMGPGSVLTDWANDGLFGEGWHVLNIGGKEYAEALEQYADTDLIIEAFMDASSMDMQMLDTGADDYSEEIAKDTLTALVNETPDSLSLEYEVVDEETLDFEIKNANKKALEEAVDAYLNLEYKQAYGAPEPSQYGIWVKGIPLMMGELLDAFEVAPWLSSLLIDGIISGVGAVLGFVPQMFVLFFLLALLEGCGYMARIAFILDRVFRKFGLSGKSFIPMLVGTGCGVPGIMATRTIENENDRRMTIMTTTFIPCGAKVPFIAMIAGAIFHHSPYVATSAYFIGLVAIIISGIVLKKTAPFKGKTTPFVMELPAYHIPPIKGVLLSTWERGSSFVKKAGTVILLSSVVVWFFSFFGFKDGLFTMLGEDELDYSFLAVLGNAVSFIFKPLGWGSWRPTVASFTGLVAKENVVGTMGILYGNGNVYVNLADAFTPIAAYSFLVFNLLCAPCFAAIGAIKKEMNSMSWTTFAITYQCLFAYCVSLMIYQFGMAVQGNMNILGFGVALAILVVLLYGLFRKPEEAKHG